MRKLNFLSFSIILFFVSPYLILFLFFIAKTDYSFSFTDDIRDAFSFTLLQALPSSLIATTLGIVGSFGLIGLRSFFKRFKHASLLINIFVLLPSAIPVLFVILSALNLIPSIEGLGAIIGLHVLINIGIVAIMFESLLLEKAGAYLELARVEGASKAKMVLQVILPILKKEIALIWISIFAFCFTSFAIPLIVGGSGSTTVEVLIYEFIRIDANWADASAVAALQSLLIFSLTILLVQARLEPPSRQASLSFLGAKYLSLIVLLPSVVILLGLLIDAVSGFHRLFSEISIAELLKLSINSFVIALTTAAFCLCALLLIAFARPSGLSRKIILGFLAPSSILTGFALLILWRDVGAASLIKISIGLTLLFAPILYRLGWDSKIMQIHGQMQTAEILGASRWKSFSEVAWPQLQPIAAKLSALAAFWAWGEFALSKVIAERTLTISLLVQSLMSSYRLNSATALVWLMFLGSAITYFIVWSLVNVSSRKPSH